MQTRNPYPRRCPWLSSGEAKPPESSRRGRCHGGRYTLGGEARPRPTMPRPTMPRAVRPSCLVRAVRPSPFPCFQSDLAAPICGPRCFQGTRLLSVSEGIPPRIEPMRRAVSRGVQASGCASSIRPRACSLSCHSSLLLRAIVTSRAWRQRPYIYLMDRMSP